MSNSRVVCKVEGCHRWNAYAINKMCNYHWDLLIEENIKKFVEDYKAKAPIK